jgi:hypothetical protein
LPWSKKEEKLASSKLDTFSKAAGQYLCGMMHKVMYGTKVREVRVTWLSRFKVISSLSYSFPSLTPIN